MSENEMNLNDVLGEIINGDFNFEANENENDFYDRFIAWGRKNIKEYQNAPKTIVPNFPVIKRIQQFEKVLNEYVSYTKEKSENSIFGYVEEEDGYEIKSGMIDSKEYEIRIRGESFGYWHDEKCKELVLKMIQLADYFSVGPGANDTVNVSFNFDNALVVHLEK